MPDADYWNHNTAYHPWILGHVEQLCDPVVLDVGAGEGLLAQRLAPICAQVIGIEPDAPTASRAQARLKDIPNVRIIETTYDGLNLEPESVDAITLVASLHHMNPEAVFTKSARLLRPGGRLLVVGLAANRRLSDWLYAAAILPIVRASSWLHQETPSIGVPIHPPKECLDDIRRIANARSPGLVFAVPAITGIAWIGRNLFKRSLTNRLELVGYSWNIMDASIGGRTHAVMARSDPSDCILVLTWDYRLC